MPTVPLYNTPQEQPQPQPGVRYQTDASPSLLGAGAEHQAELGEAAQRAGTQISDIAIKIQERENVDKVFSAEAAIKNEYIKYATEARQRTGQNAWGVADDTARWWTDAAKKYGDGLTNNAQRRLLARTMQGMQEQSIGVMSQHEATERRASLESSAKASIVGSINVAAANPAPAIVDNSRTDIVNHVNLLAKANGWDKARTDMEKGIALTNLHQQVIQSLTAANPAAAAAYFELNKNEIDGSKQAEIGKFASTATAVALGNGAADEVWGTLGPKSATEPVKLLDMEEAIRKKLQGNDVATDHAIKGVRERSQAFKDQRNETSNALEADVNKLVLGNASLTALRTSPEYLALSAQDPKAARSIYSFVENKQYTAISRANAEEVRQQQRLQRHGMAAYLAYSNPDVLAKMSENEVVNLLPSLGNEMTRHLMEKKRAIQKHPDKIIEARIDQDDFNHEAQKLGLKPFAAKSESEKQALGELKFATEQAIDQAQKDKKAPLSRDEKIQLMQKTIDNKVMKHRTLLPDDEVPVYSLTKKEMKDAYVEVGGEKVVLSTITPEFRAQATLARKQQGFDTSEAQLAQLWLLDKRNKASKGH